MPRTPYRPDYRVHRQRQVQLTFQQHTITPEIEKIGGFFLFNAFFARTSKCSQKFSQIKVIIRIVSANIYIY